MELRQGIDYDELARVVDRHGGVVVLQMGQLRDVHGAGKLGSTVVSNISKELDNIGLGHSPTELPRDQYQSALVYRKGSRIAELVEAVTEIGEHSDSLLRSFVSKDNGDAEILRKIRELVND